MSTTSRSEPRRLSPARPPGGCGGGGGGGGGVLVVKPNVTRPRHHIAVQRLALPARQTVVQLCKEVTDSACHIVQREGTVSPRPSRHAEGGHSGVG